MRLGNSYRRTVLGALPVLVLILFIGCGSFHHYPIDEVSFKSRAEIQEEGDVRATICVPSSCSILVTTGRVRSLIT